MINESKRENYLWLFLLAIFWIIQFLAHLFIKAPILLFLFVVIGIPSLMVDFGYEVKYGHRPSKKDSFANKMDRAIYGSIVEFGWIDLSDEN